MFLSKKNLRFKTLTHKNICDIPWYTVKSSHAYCQVKVIAHKGPYCFTKDKKEMVLKEPLTELLFEEPKMVILGHRCLSIFIFKICN